MHRSLDWKLINSDQSSDAGLRMWGPVWQILSDSHNVRKSSKNNMPHYPNIREYQAQLFAKQKLSPGAVTNHLCALRFL